MNTTNLKDRSEETSDRFKSALTAVFYLFTVLTVGVVLFVHGRSDLMVDLVATICYMAATAIFYQLSR